MKFLFHRKIIRYFCVSVHHIDFKICDVTIDIKGSLYGQRQFLATESPSKMMKNAFYFTLRAFFILEIFKFLSWLFDHVEKRLD